MQAGVGERPRELRWYHAAGYLFGDWGTSRLYVLGLAFTMSGHASFWYVAAMCVLVTLVGFAYTIVCKHFPDGGGVYSAARKHSSTLAVVGSLLLMADYIITAALSAYEGFRYILPSGTSSMVALYASIVAIILIGLMNIVGPRRVGVLAVWVTVASAGFYLILGLVCGYKSIGQAFIHAPTEPFKMQWSHFVNVVLALSGVEAIANMTGVMSEPVDKNAKRAIWVVLAEVVILNLVMAYAMNALPSLVSIDHADPTPIVATERPDKNAPAPEKVELVNTSTHKPMTTAEVEDYRDHMVKILATEFVGPNFSAVASFFFGLLLLSAANTAIGAMVSVQYLLARDKEMPQVFTKLNRFGMPWVGLVVATIVPVVVLAIVRNDSGALADLYAIGVVGAITINLLACASNKELELKSWERTSLWFVGLLVGGIEITIGVEKHDALIFALIIVGVGLLGRHVAKTFYSRIKEAEEVEVKVSPSGTLSALPAGGAAAGPTAEHPAPQTWRGRTTTILQSLANKPETPAGTARVLIPTRGSPKMMKFAIRYAKEKHATAYILFVREIALQFRERGGKIASESMTLHNDVEARKVFESARELCEKEGVHMVPIYVVHDSAAEMILDYAATLGVDTVLMGVSHRGAFWRTLKGDVVQEVVEFLPDSIPLLIHA